MTQPDLFEQAYLAYLRAIKQAWADVDVDELAEQMSTNDGNVMQGGCQGCGEGFSSFGSAGTMGTVGTVGGTWGTFGTMGSFGCMVTEPDTEDDDEPAKVQAGDNYQSEA